MIQDIFPEYLDNSYKNVQPSDGDYVFYFRGSTILGHLENGVMSYPCYSEFRNLLEKNTEKKTEEVFEFRYLFSLSGKYIFLACPRNITDKGSFIGEMADSQIHSEYRNVWDGYDFTGVDIFRKSKPKSLAFAAITAFHLQGWYRDNRFCGRCGHELLHDENQRMLRCPECGNMVFPKISPAVIVAVTDGDRILLTKYQGRTYKNYALVAGYTEIGETVEETVEREVFEETGLKVKNIKYYKSQPWGLSGTILYGFFCELDGDDEITLEEEELALGKWVKADELEQRDDGISLTWEMINLFIDQHKK